MAKKVPTKEERDANLRALKEAVLKFGNKEISRLENETFFLRAVLEGRGIKETGTANLSEASKLVVDEINEFLETE